MEKKLTWWQFQKTNPYIYVFFILCGFVALIIYHKYEFTTGWFIAMLAFFALTLFLLIYKGFYQAWRDYKTGNSR